VGREGERTWERGRRKEKGRKAKEEKGRGGGIGGKMGEGQTWLINADNSDIKEQ